MLTPVCRKDTLQHIFGRICRADLSASCIDRRLLARWLRAKLFIEAALVVHFQPTGSFERRWV